MSKVFYIIKRGKKKFSGISNLIPEGPSLSLYDDQKKADKVLKKLAKRFKQSFTNREIEDPVSACADYYQEGYCGALFNDTVPIFFHEYSDKRFFVMRYEENKPLYLSNSGEWLVFEKEEGMERVMNYDQTDNLLRSLLTDELFWGWNIHEKLYSMKREGEDDLYSIEESRGSSTGPCRNRVLFARKHLAADYAKFVLNIDEEKLVLEEVTQIEELVKESYQAGIGVLVNPFYNRCMQGRFWFHKETILFESFSGFWKMREDGVFEKTKNYRTDRRLTSSSFIWQVKEGTAALKTRSEHAFAEIRKNEPGTLPVAYDDLGSYAVQGQEHFDKFAILLEKEEIESGEIQLLRSFFARIIEEKQSSRFKDKIGFRIFGFDSETIAPFEIHAIRRWYQMLIGVVPYIPYFLDSAAEQIQTFVLSIHPQAEQRDNGNPVELLQTILQVTLNGMHCAKVIDDEPADCVQKIFDAFDIEPEADLYEKMLASLDGVSRENDDL